MDITEAPVIDLKSVSSSAEGTKVERFSLPKIIEKQKTARTHEDRVAFSEMLFGQREPSQETKGTYADVLADEYNSTHDVIAKIDSANPDITNEERTQLLNAAGITEWQYKMFTVMSRERNKIHNKLDWGKMSDGEKRTAFRTVFARLLNGNDQDQRQEWTLTAMLATQRRIMALQLASEARVKVKREADRIKRVTPVTAIGAVGGGERASTLDQNPKKKRSLIGKMVMFPVNVATSPFRASRSIYRNIFTSEGRSKLSERIDYFNQTRNWTLTRKRIFSYTKSEIPKNASFDPDRQVDGVGLDEFQRVYVEKFRSEFQDARGNKDPDGRIGGELLRLSQAQADTGWSLFRTQFRYGQDLNVIENGHFTNPGFKALESGIKGVGQIDLQYDGKDILDARLTQLMALSLKRQAPEVAQKERTEVGNKVDRQIESLTEKTKEKDRTTLKEPEKAKLTQLEADKKAQEESIKLFEEYPSIDGSIANLDREKTNIETETAEARTAKATGLSAAEKAGQLAQAEVDKLVSKRDKVLKARQEAQTQRRTKLLTDITTLEGKIEELRTQETQDTPMLGVLGNRLVDTETRITQLLSKQVVQAKGGIFGAIKSVLGNPQASGLDENAVAVLTQLSAQYDQITREIVRIQNIPNVINKHEKSITDAKTEIKDIEDNQMPGTITEMATLEGQFTDANAELKIKQDEEARLNKLVTDQKSKLDRLKTIDEDIKALKKKKTDIEAKLPVVPKGQTPQTPIELAKAATVTAKAELERIETEIGEIIGKPKLADTRQKDILETYRDLVLKSDRWDEIQSRAMDPHFVNRPSGVESDASDTLEVAMELRPHVPPAYFEMMRIVAGDAALTNTTEGIALYKKMSKLVTPEIFMTVYLKQSSPRRAALEAILGATLPDRVDFFDKRLQDETIGRLMAGSVNSEFIQEIHDELKHRVVDQQLGRLTQAEITSHEELNKTRMKSEELKTVVEANTKSIEAAVDAQIPTCATARETSRTTIEPLLTTLIAAHGFSGTFDQEGLRAARELLTIKGRSAVTPILASHLVDAAGGRTTLGVKVTTILQNNGFDPTAMTAMSGDQLAEVANGLRQFYQRFGEAQNRPTAEQHTKRITDIARSFMTFGMENTGRIQEGAVLSLVMSRANHELVTDIEQALESLKRKDSNCTLEVLLTYLPNKENVSLIEALIRDSQKVIEQGYKAVRSRRKLPKISSVHDIHPEDLPEFTGVAFQKIHTPPGTPPQTPPQIQQESVELRNLLITELDEVDLKRTPETFDRQFWGLEGDDLIVALETHFLHKPDRLRLAQGYAYRIEQYRKTKLQPQY